MYEMCVGPQAGSSDLVWHVVARHTRSSLCGVELSAAGPGPADTDRHCASCMTHFQQLLDAGGDHRKG